MKKFVAIFIVLAAVLSGLLYWQLNAQRAELNRASGGSATLEGVSVKVSARLNARILKLHVDEGAQVEAGQLLAELDCREPEAMLAEVEAGLSAATEAVEMARTGVESAQLAERVAAKQSAVAALGPKLVRSQRAVLEVQRDAASVEAERVKKLERAAAATPRLLEQANAGVDALAKQVLVADVQLEQARAQNAVVEEQETGSSLQLKLAQSKLNAAQAELDRLTASRERALIAMGECKLYAPRSGLVQERAFEEGELAMPGSRLFELVDISVLEARFYLPNAELSVAQLGALVEVQPDCMRDQVFQGRIRRVSSSAEFTPRNVQTREDRDRLVFAVDVEIDNLDETLRPGMAVQIRIPGTEREAQ
ncbi:MAG: efflux RND transporter periplasmic adaptor subunit [Myxococcota bacterium]|nr:efflux RND transporter periplasmic adaptor subunit [Myxococcota bacterium]